MGSLTPTPFYSSYVLGIHDFFAFVAGEPFGPIYFAIGVLSVMGVLPIIASSVAATGSFVDIGAHFVVAVAPFVLTFIVDGCSKDFEMDFVGFHGSSTSASGVSFGFVPSLLGFHPL
ncbi:hypothetical protein SUGI_1129400 [Cryptomeria japonica]|nr:hypothetical protein SUGI_1129400 [Cryptomeria japonica]